MNFFTSSGLSLALPTALEAPRDATQSADSEQIKTKEDDDESKSSSDNAEGGSGDDQDADHRPKKKRYHRHSQHQIQEMERVFKECPHPDEKQRLELSRDLKLDPRQVKFWFQNKRTQVKAQHERHDNAYLRSENEKLRAENLALRDAMWNAACPNCGGPANPAEMSFDEHQLRLENVKLREEIDRISAIAAKHIGRPVSTFTGTTSTASSTLNLGFSAPQPSPDILAPGPSLADVVARSLGVSEAEKPMMIELAVAAMEELTQVAQASEPLWVTDPLTGIEVIDNEQYLQRFPRAMGAAASGCLKSEGTRETSLVILNASSLVEIFMDVTRWTEMFSCIVARALLVEVLCSGVGGTQEGAMQLMYAEFQLPSPMVASREHYFLRYAKQVNHVWVVVDVSVENLRGHAGAPPALRRCKRRPSGCIIEEMPTGYSKVTWVEHGEAEERGVHRLYQQLVSSGMAFGAQRWVATLSRQCERMAALMASTTAATRDLVSPAPEGRRSLLRLAQRMTDTFSTGVSASVAHTWITLSGTGGDDVRVLIRKSVDDPGRPPGIVLCAATSLWLPRPPARVFDFLRDERFRTEWDILSNMGVVEEMVHVAKGQDSGNSISLLRVNASGSNQPNMLIFQDCCTDQSCSLVVYAPVDVAAMTAVLNGGDPETVALLPSGFAVLPDTPQRRQLHLGNPSVTNSAAASVPNSPGSLLTVAFQILVDHTPTAKLSLGSVATVNNLISSTVLRIRNALACDAP